jgi:putative DNA primase/helicase
VRRMTRPSNMACWAERYIECFAFALVPLRGKVPIGEAWNSEANLISTSQEAREYWTIKPGDNIGMCLEPSGHYGMASCDADHVAGTRIVLAAEGIDFDALMAVTPTIIGRAPRLEFSMPPGVKLGRKAIVWPPRVAGEKSTTVLEFRAGRVQDVLPPSIHPDLGVPYRWLTPPRDGFPPLPESLLRLWLDFDAFKRRARNLCPWADPEPEPAPRPPRQARERTGPSVISTFNDAHDAVALIESHGYTRAGKRRWKSPHCDGAAGIVALPNGKFVSHNTSDPLYNDHALDAFDVFRILEHRGDFSSAVRAAAQALGLNQEARHGRR